MVRRGLYPGKNNAHKATEVIQVVWIDAAIAWVVDIGESFRRGRYRGQLLELDGSQPAFSRDQ